MFLGKCPYCNNGNIQIRDKDVRGKKVKLYACSNAHWKTEDGEMFELHDDASCSFRIWQNALAKYGKWLSFKEIKELLEYQRLMVEFISKRYGKPIRYNKEIMLDKEYGVRVIWD